MRVSQFLAAASVIAATTAQDLATVLSEQPSLSSLVKLLGLAENTTEFLASQQGATLFAPNNVCRSHYERHLLILSPLSRRLL
jgi:uncharacterized surface protein with fasciclin (FAS1) repeats